MPTPHYGQPRYRTIADELRTRIETGAIPPGSILPAESALTAEFKASRGTIRQAIAVLRAEGVVRTEHGRGAFAVADRAISPQRVRSNIPGEVYERKAIVRAGEALARLFDIRPDDHLIESEVIERDFDRVVRIVRRYTRLDD